MVLAIGDLAGATVVTLLAATATQFARVGRYFLTNFDPSQYSALGSPWFWQPYRKPWR
jgi:hypothetical protein